MTVISIFLSNSLQESTFNYSQLNHSLTHALKQSCNAKLTWRHGSISVLGVFNSNSVILYPILLCFWRGNLFFCFVSKSKTKEDQLAQSSSLEQGVGLQKWMWVSFVSFVLLHLSLSLSLDALIATLVSHLTVEQPKWSCIFVKNGSRRQSQLVRVKWDGMSFLAEQRRVSD